MTIAGENEPGEKLEISGTIYKADGKSPYPDIIIYAFHTDNTGHYSKNGTETGVQKWHGRLYGWCKTDGNGQYKIETIRPARYPDNSMPAHIHAAIKKDNEQIYWITDYVFRDDNLVNEKYLSSLSNVGGTGVVDINKSAENTWTGKRDIVLTQ
jgi:protocatechuate 3,4-dioxygenase beta subunit